MSEVSAIPRLETDRLILRAFTNQDLDGFAEIVADEEVMRYATYHGAPMTRSQAWNWLCLMLGHWQLRGYGLWAVELKNTGRLIGRVGLQYLEWFDDVELVWMLAKSAWGRGFAEEGVRAAVEYGFDTLNLPGLTAVIRPENKPSIRLAERLGMVPSRDITREGVEFIEFRLDKPAS